MTSGLLVIDISLNLYYITHICLKETQKAVDCFVGIEFTDKLELAISNLLKTIGKKSLNIDMLTDTSNQVKDPLVSLTSEIKIFDTPIYQSKEFC
ncbi:hypothetical protein RhiirA4_481624 [Rhizophagus irregularis]|uniref:Uncharacterized protein n=1 Tax=Rhizophagus irregularis TaxID=588596 RepID=A0A2I1HJU7_9GLOM|nr:hypothetical protein RhiirA4_481624 [Rhizophagus irregularis]